MPLDTPREKQVITAADAGTLPINLMTATLEQQTALLPVDLLPTEGGSYTRDPLTGALTRNPA